jgi:hypothetical protein
MRVLIQHNFTSGLGDFLSCIYDYFKNCENLKKLGYNEFNIKFFLNKNVYLHKESFFEFFKLETFQKVFKTIEIINESITNEHYDGMDRVFSIGNVPPGSHLWDLFIETGYDKSVKESIVTYSYVKPDLSYLDLFNDRIVKKYNELKELHHLDKYSTIYYRTHDLQDNENTYSNFDVEFTKIIKNNDKVFVCSNSFLFKEYIKKFGDKVITYDILDENTVGNHYNYNRVFYEEKEKLHIRTDFVIYEMLTLSDSTEVNFFTLWGRESNFLLLSKVKNTPIITYQL